MTKPKSSSSGESYGLGFDLGDVSKLPCLAITKKGPKGELEVVNIIAGDEVLAIHENLIQNKRRYDKIGTDY